MFTYYTDIFAKNLKLSALTEWSAANTPLRSNEISKEAIDTTTQSKLEEVKAKLAAKDRESSVAELEKEIGEISSTAREQAGKVLLNQVVENYIHNNPGLKWEFQRQFLAVDFDSADSIFDTRAFDASTITILGKYGLSQSDLITALNNRLSASSDTIASEDIAMNQWPVEMNDTLKAREENIKQIAASEQGFADTEQAQIRNHDIAQMTEMEQGYADTAENLAKTIALKDLGETLNSLDITNIPKGDTAIQLQAALNTVIPESDMQNLIGKPELIVDGIPGKNTKKAIQIALNKITNSNLVIDGKIGKNTLAALSNIQEQTFVAQDTSWDERLNTAHAPIDEDTGERYTQDTTAKDAEQNV